MGYSPGDGKRVRHDLETKQQQCLVLARSFHRREKMQREIGKRRKKRGKEKAVKGSVR